MLNDDDDDEENEENNLDDSNIYNQFTDVVTVPIDRFEFLANDVGDFNKTVSIDSSDSFMKCKFLEFLLYARLKINN